VLLDAPTRRLIDPGAGWALEGLVYAPSTDLPAGSVGLATAALRRARDRVPASALIAVPDAADPANAQMQALLRCTQVERLDDALLVATCNGG